MTENGGGEAAPLIRSGPFIISGALVGAGMLITFAGLAIGSSYLVSATRRWIREMEVPPSQLAKLRWAQARAAASAAADAWQNGSSTTPARVS
jgi:hypothetical protein